MAPSSRPCPSETGAIRPPDLVIVTDDWDPEGGGRERYVAELASWLGGSGMHVLVLCRRSRGVPAAVVTVQAVRGPTMLAEPRLSRELSRLRRRFPGIPVLTTRPQVEATHYQLHSGIQREGLEAERRSYRSWLRRALFWPTLRLNPSRLRRLAAERGVLSGGSRVRLMAFTHATAAKLVAGLGVDRRRVSICPLGIDLERFHAPVVESRDAPGPPARALRTVFVGHNFALKGLRQAIEAVARGRARGLAVDLTVVGSCRDSGWRRLADRLGAAGHVHFAGALPQAELARLYRESDVLLHPTYFDAFARVMLEALASGCAVVATRACEAAELLQGEAAGIVIDDPEDVQAITDALEGLCVAGRLATMRPAAVSLARRFPFRGHAEAVRAWLRGAPS